MKIDAKDLHFRTLNEKVRESGDREIIIENCMGHRYIGSGIERAHIMVLGTPGNALGAYCGGLPIDHGLGYRYTALAGMGFVLLGLLTVVIYIRKYPRHEMR